MVAIYDLILKIIKPFVIWWGGMHMPFTHKKITGLHYYLWRNQIDVGTVLLTTTRGEFSNLINPIALKHAGIYVGNLGSGPICYVLEAIGKGVVLTDLVSFLTTKDVVVGCRPTFLRDEETFAYTIHEAAKTYQGLPYDYLFKKGKKAFYCYELAAATLNYVYPELRLKCGEILKSKKVYDHNTFLDKDFFEVIFDSRVKK